MVCGTNCFPAFGWTQSDARTFMDTLGGQNTASICLSKVIIKTFNLKLWLLPFSVWSWCKQETCRWGMKAWSLSAFFFLVFSTWVHCQPLYLCLQLSYFFLAPLRLDWEEGIEKASKKLSLVWSCLIRLILPLVGHFQESEDLPSLLGVCTLHFSWWGSNSFLFCLVLCFSLVRRTWQYP